MNIKLLIYAGLAAALLGAVWFVYDLGWDNAMNKAQADQVVAIEKAIAEQKAKQDAVNDVGADNENQRVRTEIKFRTITKEVIKYVQTHPDDVECLDADGVRIWNEAGQSTTTDVPGKPDAAMRGKSVDAGRRENVIGVGSTGG